VQIGRGILHKILVRLHRLRLGSSNKYTFTRNCMMNDYLEKSQAGANNFSSLIFDHYQPRPSRTSPAEYVDQKNPLILSLNPLFSAHCRRLACPLVPQSEICVFRPPISLHLRYRYPIEIELDLFFISPIYCVYSLPTEPNCTSAWSSNLLLLKNSHYRALLTLSSHLS
jgi:hypothetical protein